MNKIIKITLVFGFILISNMIYSQCDSIASVCSNHFTKKYVSDGQQYRALLIDDEIAEFNVTFYGGTVYRIAACSGLSDGNLVFVIKDQENNVLFTNEDYSNAPYWDFSIASTINCKIEAILDTKKLSSGCAVMLIGFKQ